MNDLAAFLSDRPQRNPVSRGFDSEFFFEFDLSAGQQIFFELGFAFWDGPRAVVFVFPKRSTRMHEQEFDAAVFSPKHEQTRADQTALHHACFAANPRSPSHGKCRRARRTTRRPNGSIALLRIWAIASSTESVA